MSSIARIALSLTLAAALGLWTVPLAAQTPSLPGQGAAAAPTATAGLSYLEFGLLPDFELPLGADGGLYSFGAGSTATIALRPAAMPMFFAGLGMTYDYLSTKAPGTSLSAAALSAQAGFNFQLTRAISLRLRGEAGYFGAMLNGGASELDYNPFLGAGLSAGLELAPGMTLGLGASYRSWLVLFSGVSVNLGISYNLPLGGGAGSYGPGLTPLNASGRGLGFAALGLDTIFPVFYKHYDDHPIGSIVLRNYETVPARNIKAYVNVRSYMDEAKPLAVPAEIAPGGQVVIPLYGLFTDKILGVVEATKLPVSITLEYEQYGQMQKDETIATLSVLDRNAITWDDDRKAAAFISAKDPEAIRLAKGVANTVKASMSSVLNQNLQLAMAMHDMLKSQGVTYVKDPNSALETNDKKVVDFILFPQQTLGYNSGKCSDLTILYCSLLESIGVPTALITVPGHILMAVDLEMNPDEAKAAFSQPENLIFRDGKVWLPIETTDRTEGFQGAWSEGAKQWRDGSAKKNVAFYDVREAWKEYAPVVYAGSPVATPRYDLEKGAAAFKAELAAYQNLEVGPRIAAIQADIKKNGATSELLNKLGVLYARFGYLDKAQEQFTAALAKKGDGPALFNLGNVLFLKGKYADALAYYNKAVKANPNNAKALLAVARTNAALGKFDAALASYTALKALDPALAAGFAYLGGQDASGARAADIESNKGNLLWQD